MTTSAPSWSPTAARSPAGSCARRGRWAIARRRSIPRPTRTRCTCAAPTWPPASARRRRARATSTSRPSSPRPSGSAPMPCIRATASCPRTPTSREACAEAGLVFIGPSPAAIAAMGNKAAAKRRMLEAGVPCVPGYQGADQSDAALAREAERIGFPVMVKAAAGGGGRGMRLVRTKKDLAGGAGRRARRGRERLRLGRADPGEGRRRRPPCRDPGARRRARQRHPSGRARLLGAAPAPEGAGGGAVAGRRSRAARAHGRGRGRRRPGHRLHQRRHGRVPARQRMAPSISWR